MRSNYKSKISRDYSHLGNHNKVSFEKFSSADVIKSKEFLKELLNKGGFLL